MSTPVVQVAGASSVASVVAIAMPVPSAHAQLADPPVTMPAPSAHTQLAYSQQDEAPHDDAQPGSLAALAPRKVDAVLESDAAYVEAFAELGELDGAALREMLAMLRNRAIKGDWGVTQAEGLRGTDDVRTKNGAAQKLMAKYVVCYPKIKAAWLPETRGPPLRLTNVPDPISRETSLMLLPPTPTMPPAIPPSRGERARQDEPMLRDRLNIPAVFSPSVVFSPSWRSRARGRAESR